MILTTYSSFEEYQKESNYIVFYDYFNGNNENDLEDDYSYNRDEY